MGSWGLMSTDLFATTAFRDITAGEILQLLGLFLVKVQLRQVPWTVLVDPEAHDCGMVLQGEGGLDK